jgi:hypothetical protein
MPARPSKKKHRAKPATPPNPAAFFSQAEVDAANRQREAGNHNPAVVVDAFTTGGDAFTVAGFQVPAIHLGRYILIERIKSPVLENNGWDKLTNQQLAELIFVCLNPEQRTRDLLAEDEAATGNGQPGRAFEHAVATFADSIPVPSLQPLGFAIGLRIRAAFSTVVTPAVNTDAKKKALPSSTVKSATASAGG